MEVITCGITADNTLLHFYRIERITLIITNNRFEKNIRKPHISITLKTRREYVIDIRWKRLTQSFHGMIRSYHDMKRPYQSMKRPYHDMIRQFLYVLKALLLLSHTFISIKIDKKGNFKHFKCRYVIKK